MVFPFPYDPNPFPRAARGQAPETPSLCWIEVLFRAGRAPDPARSECLPMLEGNTSLKENAPATDGVSKGETPLAT